MPEKHRFAVLFALDVNSPTPGSSGPSEQRLRHVMETGPNSVRQFWTDNVPFLEIEMTVFPRVTIAPIRMPPVPGDRPRTELIDAAVAASGAVGFDRAAFDHVFVVVHGGAGFQYGSNGKGKDAVVFTNNDFSSICHEFGHCLGFDHSRGFWSTRNWGTWSDEYGSNYDVMAFPSGYQLTQPDQLPPGVPLAGPMVARAVVHYDKPNALQAIGKVIEFDLHDTPISEQVWAAGRSGPGQPELLVFYTEGIRDARHQLLIEYRQPDPSPQSPSRWDQGLNGTHTQGNAPGVVIQTIKAAVNSDFAAADFDRPYYAGTLSLAAADYDVDVLFPWGTYTVAVKPPVGVADPAPDHVQLTVGRAPLGPIKVRIRPEVREVTTPQRTEMRIPPDLPPFWGPQEYVVSAVFTTWELAAYTSNVGGISSLNQAEDSWLEWTVDGTAVPADGAAHQVRGGLFAARVDSLTRILTVSNPNSLAQTEVVVAKVHATDYGAGAHLKTEYEMTFAGETAEPGESLQRLLTWYDFKFRRRYRIPGPPQLSEIQQLRFAYRELERAAPVMAARLRPLMDEEEVAWRQQLAAAVAWRQQ